MSGYIGSKASVTQVDGYNRTEADGRYVNASGDTMTGALGIQGSTNSGVLKAGTAGTHLTVEVNDGAGEVKLKAQDDSGNNYWKYITFHTEGGSGTLERVRIDPQGRVTMPYQPAAFGRFTTITSPTTNYVVGLSDVTARGGMVVSSNRITVPVSGYYLVHAHQLISTSSSNYFHIRINGTTDTYAYVNVDDTEDEAVQTIVNLSANDYIDFYMTNASYTWGSTHSSWFVTLLG